jgi:hypothetical protein
MVTERTRSSKELTVSLALGGLEVTNTLFVHDQQRQLVTISREAQERITSFRKKHF